MVTGVVFGLANFTGFFFSTFFGVRFFLGTGFAM
jgi:hypothetical protein